MSISRLAQTTLLKEKICLLHKKTEQTLRGRPVRKLETKISLKTSDVSLTSQHCFTFFFSFTSENITELWLVLEVYYYKNPQSRNGYKFLFYSCIKQMCITCTWTSILICIKNDLLLVVLTRTDIKNNICRYQDA